MVRGRAPARGTRRGAAAAGQRAQPQSGEASTSATPVATGTSNTPVRSTPSAPSRGGATTRATRGPAAGRFRPKVVRRDEAERDTLARQEEQKAQDRAADERRARGRSRFRSKRSRGDAMGARGGFGRPIGGASGPFSSGVGGKAHSHGHVYSNNAILTISTHRRRWLVRWWRRRWWWFWWWRIVLTILQIRFQGWLRPG